VNKLAKETKHLIPVKAPVPPMLATAMGYPGDARFVSFHWMHQEVEVEYSDGRMNAIASYYTYFLYIQHPAVKPHLKAYDIGFPHQSEATHALILDREKLELYIAPVNEAEAFLTQQQQQRPIQQPVRKTQQEFIAMSTNAMQEDEHPDMAIQRRIEANYTLHHGVATVA
jgi:hypothetical protein